MTSVLRGQAKPNWGMQAMLSWQVCAASAICFMWFEHWVRRALSRAACTAGKSSATKTPMMAMTTNNSTSVKPAGDRAARLERALPAIGPLLMHADAGQRTLDRARRTSAVARAWPNQGGTPRLTTQTSRASSTVPALEMSAPLKLNQSAR